MAAMIDTDPDCASASQAEISARSARSKPSINAAASRRRSRAGRALRAAGDDRIDRAHTDSGLHRGSRSADRLGTAAGPPLPQGHAMSMRKLRDHRHRLRRTRQRRTAPARSVDGHLGRHVVERRGRATARACPRRRLGPAGTRPQRHPRTRSPSPTSPPGCWRSPTSSPRETFHYAGDSVGGCVGLQLLLDAPHRVASATLLCTGAKIGTPDGWRERAATVRSAGTAAVLAGAAQRWFAPGFAEREPRRQRSAAAMPCATPMPSPTRRTCEALAGFDVTDRLQEIITPVLAVAGSDDIATRRSICSASPPASRTGGSSCSTAWGISPRPRHPSGRRS